jgi:hypothetical protein
MSEIVTVTEKEEEKKEQNEQEEQNGKTEVQKQGEKEDQIFVKSERQAFEYIKEEFEGAKQVENHRAEIILRLAHKIEVLPGIAKDTVASIIASGFRRLKIETIHVSYVYQVLGPEYKNATFSKMSKEQIQRRMRLGYDTRTGDYLLSLNDVINEKIPKYSRSTLLNIIDWYKEKVHNVETENITLKRELKETAIH